VSGAVGALIFVLPSRLGGALGAVGPGLAHGRRHRGPAAASTGAAQSTGCAPRRATARELRRGRRKGPRPQASRWSGGGGQKHGPVVPGRQLVLPANPPVQPYAEVKGWPASAPERVAVGGLRVRRVEQLQVLSPPSARHVGERRRAPVARPRRTRVRAVDVGQLHPRLVMRGGRSSDKDSPQRADHAGPSHRAGPGARRSRLGPPRAARNPDAFLAGSRNGRGVRGGGNYRGSRARSPPRARSRPAASGNGRSRSPAHIRIRHVHRPSRPIPCRCRAVRRRGRVSHLGHAEAGGA